MGKPYAVFCKFDPNPATITLKRWLAHRSSKRFYTSQLAELFTYPDRVIDKLVAAGKLHCLTPEAPVAIRWYEIIKNDVPTS